MLKVSIHAGSLRDIDVVNRLDWLDIGYVHLQPIANYKAVLFRRGVGAGPPVLLHNYPRWSGSLWDLVARAIALTLSRDHGPGEEAVPVVPDARKHVAWASRLSAVIEHHPVGNAKRRRVLSTVEVWRFGRAKGGYRARFVEDLMPVREVDRFVFRPERLCPAELILHAALMRLHGKDDCFPPRPTFVVPKLVKDGLEYVPIHKLPEPGRTGFLRWLHADSVPPEEHAGAPDGIAPAPSYLQFLKSAV